MIENLGYPAATRPAPPLPPATRAKPMPEALILRRWTQDARPTIGGLYHRGELLCGTVEDQKQPRGVKVPGKTRIPEGTYRLAWRDAGRWATRFKREGLPGSLELRDVPGFSDVLIHWGNSQTDTEGCVLPNRYLYLDERRGGKSRIATLGIYRLVHETGGEWELNVT